MTLTQAMSKVDSKPKPQSFFDGFDDWMENREPGWKAQEAAKRAARAAAKAMRRTDLQPRRRASTHFRAPRVGIQQADRDPRARQAARHAQAIGSGAQYHGRRIDSHVPLPRSRR